MFPIKDTVRSRSFPWMNWLLIAANVAVFIHEAQMSRGALAHFIGTYGMVPTRLWLHTAKAWPTLFTSMFLHGGWFHLLSNMWVLFIFGDNVEDRMGPFRYLIFYLLSGLAAGVTQAAILPTSHVPTVGASGAIAGVLGAYMLFYPRGRVLTLVPVFFFITFVEIPAWIFIGIWFLTQLYSGWMALLPYGVHTMGGIAWWAHIGGFMFGLFFANAFAQRHYRRFADEFYRW